MCKSLIQLLRSIDMLKYFKCICIDDKNILSKLPSEISRVPAVIIPSINKCLFGRDIFVWVNSLRNNRAQNFNLNTCQPDPHSTSCQNTNQHQTNQHPTNQQTNDRQYATQKIKGPIGYVTQEMSGISDTYAYTTADAVPQHTYVQCNELNGNSIYTAPEKQSKINASIQPNYLKDATKKRVEQDEEIKKLYVKQKEKAALAYVDEKRQQNEQIINKLVEQQQNNIFGLLNTK